ncbi:hypothetical protein GYMLUDRAFT_212866 [Collybiopsis luxurians FD-317 M1]|nr:hypothetical protein GYMLUDRAFT_212866 [Collybiopsis luxurians FD-317 M1]
MSYSLRPSNLSVRRRSGKYYIGDENLIVSHEPSDEVLSGHTEADREQPAFDSVTLDSQLYVPYSPPRRSDTRRKLTDLNAKYLVPGDSYILRSLSTSSRSETVPVPGKWDSFARARELASFSQVSLPTAQPPSSTFGTDCSGTLHLSRGNSNVSGSTLDCDHEKLISSLKTTEKFTTKWPRPKSLPINGTSGPGWKNRKGIGIAEEAVLELEEGYCLGLDRIDKWTRFKWCLTASVTTVLCYGSSAMVCAISTWFRTWNHADVMYVADNDILILMTLAASILVFNALVGLTGALLNSRPILAVYTLLLWPAMISMLAVGYTSYKRYAFSLDHKLNFSWSQYYTPLGRLMIQNSLRCCGYYDPLHEATVSNKCYPRTPLPGCKGKLYQFEHENLSLIWSTTFSVLPLHLINIAVALLCSNHVTSAFGKGITPKEYRLTEQDLQADAEKISEEMKRMKIECVSRPAYSRASSSLAFREDREERKWLLERDDF